VNGAVQSGTGAATDRDDAHAANVPETMHVAGW